MYSTCWQLQSKKRLDKLSDIDYSDDVSIMSDYYDIPSMSEGYEDRKYIWVYSEKTLNLIIDTNSVWHFEVKQT